MSRVPLTAAEIEDERALVDSYGMLGKGIQEAIEVHNSRLGQMRRAMQQNEDAMKNQQNEIEDLKRKLRLKDEAEAKNGDLMRRLERESAERMRRLEKEFADKERFLEEKYSGESKGHRDATARLSDQVDSQLRTINELNNIVSDHERTISRLMGDLKTADQSFAEYRDKFAQMDDENKQLQRLLDDASLKRESAQDRVRFLEDQCEHAKGNLINALSSDVSEASMKSFNSHATVQELAQKAASILIDLKDREQGFSKKDQQANAALSSAANKILALERDMQTYHQAFHEVASGLETALSGVESSSIQQSLRDTKHQATRSGGVGKNMRMTSVDEDKLVFVQDLVNMTNQTVQLLVKSQKRSNQLFKLVNKKNEMLVMVAASLRQQTTQADGLQKDLNDTAMSYSNWAMEVGREVPANPLTELKPVQSGVQNASSLAVVFERMGAATYSTDSVLANSYNGYDN
jgi:chromosome segregation ATPase